MSPKEDIPRHPAATPRIGTITEWMDEKGYGWVDSDGKRWFVHIKDFEPSQPRPRQGEHVRFRPGQDPHGRPRATQVAIRKTSTAGGGTGLWLGLVLLLAMPITASAQLPLPWWAGAAAMLIVSVISYAMVSIDKQRAVAGAWRLSERALHLTELLGGWPGSLLAQRRLRHKCAKPGYQAAFWAIVLLHQLAALDVILHHQLSRTMLDFLNR